MTHARSAGMAAALSLSLLAGCTDDLPTAGGTDRFPDGLAPTTIEVLFTAADVLIGEAAVYDNFADPRTTSYLLAAEDFDGELDAHVLARFPHFPDSVMYSVGGTVRTDSLFEYVSGEMTTVVNPAASSAEGGATLRLWAVEQAWDSSQVTWQNAADGQPWTMPGGTRGALLAEAVWTPGDTIQADTVIWQLDSLAVRTMAAEGAQGVMITSETPDTRLQLRYLELRPRVRPESAQDTTLAVAVGSTAQTFVFSPEPPVGSDVYRLGGITGARTVLRLDLVRNVPGCPGAGTFGCDSVSLKDVTLNHAELVLQPRAVPSGFRPLNTSPFLVRRVVEPDLGRLAPLGQVILSDTVSAAMFAPDADPDPLRVSLTTAIRALIQTDSTALSLALLGESAAGQFGYQWYEAAPLVRLVYTLPLTPRLP
jgi:hypothetical protein